MIGAVVAKPGFSLTEARKATLFSLLKQFETLVVSDDMDGKFFSDNLRRSRVKVVSVGGINEKRYAYRFDEFVLKAGEHGVQVVVTVGGDGIASYMATAILRQKDKVKVPMGILGFAAGTANVGPIVLPKNVVPTLTKGHRLDSIEVTCGGKVLGYGFNDIIIGRTFLGTVDGRMVNLNARAMAEEGRAVEEPDPDMIITGKDFSILLNGKKMTALPDVPVRQICISTMHQENLYGRTVLGGVTEACGFKHPAALALLDKVSTDARPETWGAKDFRTTTHLCFDEKDSIRISGIAEAACVVIDGNPFVLEKDTLDFRCVPESVEVYGLGRRYGR